MNWKTHIAFGLFAALVSFRLFKMNWLMTGIFFVVVTIATLMPDIDKPESKFGRRTGILSKIVSLLFGHRGIMHSVWLLVAIPAVLWLFINRIIAWAFFIGYGAHLLSDSLTLMGVNWFHPFRFLRTHGMIETGTIGETIVFLIMVIANVVFGLHLFGLF
ncbi:hypothetical protein DRJ17_01750 [Candidatus Woesearchaeota archaeon]|nr:MAG: hypothetical protein DRJ17_01750 [Candidatus Woesearchaeota archaeon]